jgi:hypothetical protein
MLAARRIGALVVGLAALPLLATLTSCISPAESGPQVSSIDTVSGVGALPDLPTAASDTSDPGATAGPDTTDDTVSTATTIPFDSVPSTETVGELVAGNRVIMIGDSLTASISKRYGNEACLALVPMGWQVEVDAETGRFIDFGKRVLDKRLDAATWDVAIIFLGNNYGADRAVYQSGLHNMLLRLYPRPVVLVTTTLFRTEQQEVNDAIREEAGFYGAATVIDWSTITADDPALTGDDGLHLTERGRARLGYQLAGVLGKAPVEPGDCLATSFHDDSAGSPNGPSSTVKPKPTSTTVKPTSTTTKPPTSSSTPPSSTPSSSSAPTSSVAPTTAPPTTPAPTTSAPGEGK